MIDFKDLLSKVKNRISHQNAVKADLKDEYNLPKNLMFDQSNTVFEPVTVTNTIDYGTRPLTVEETKEYMDKIKECVDTLFVEGIHFGKMDGVKKKFIFRPGCELIIMMCGVRQRTEIVESVQDYDKNIFSFTAKTWLVSGTTGCIVSEGYGICSSAEEQFNNRNPKDLPNILIKLAKKRSLSDSVLGLGLSYDFSQDMELVPPVTAPVEKKASEKQIAYIESLLKAHNNTTAALDKYILDTYNIEGYKNITSKIASEIIAKYKALDEKMSS